MRILSFLVIYSASAAYVGSSLLPTTKNVSTSCSLARKPVTLINGSSVTAMSSYYYARLTTTYVLVSASTPTTRSVTTNSSTPSSNTGYIKIINEWRAKLSLAALTQDTVLEKNAFKTCLDGRGQMVHELNPGSYAQVLAPGNMHQNFERIFVGGWLCEKPEMKGLNGACTTMSAGWYYTGTGHADILTSKTYTKIGCGSFGGITGCDLA